MGILIGLLLIGFGIATIRWNYGVANSLRSLDILDRIGGGDVYTGAKVLGIICIFIGLTLVFGLWELLLKGIIEAVAGIGQ